MIGLLGSAGFGDICARAKCFPSGSASPAFKLFEVNEFISVHGLSFHSRITCLRGGCAWANCSTSMTIFLISINMSLDTSFHFLIPTSGYYDCVLASLSCFTVFLVQALCIAWASGGAALSPGVDQGFGVFALTFAGMRFLFPVFV